MPDETLGQRIQRSMGENGALGHLTYAQHQRLKSVETEEELRAFLVDVGFLARYRGPEPSPDALRRAKMVLRGEVDPDEANLAAFLAIVAAS